MIPGTREENGRVELSVDLSDSPLYNEDLAPTSLKRRTWSTMHIAALWVGMAVCIPTYMLAASLMMSGLTWWQAVLAVFLGNLIIYIPLALNGHAGAKYGIPFPVFLRASFGTKGSNIPAMLRAAVACGWFGIQTWIGGNALFMLTAVFLPDIREAAPISQFIGISIPQLIAFLGFWSINVMFILAGTESIKWLETCAAPVLIAIGIGLGAWGLSEGGGLTNILENSGNFTKPTATAYRDGSRVRVSVTPVTIDGKSRASGFRAADSKKKLADSVQNQTWLETEAKSVFVRIEGESGSFEKEIPVTPKPPEGEPGGMNWGSFFMAITAMVGFWATLSLNIPDFTRFAKDQKSQILGQAIGLPATMGFYAFIGIIVTCAAVVIFKDIIVTEQAPWDPIVLLGRFENPVIVVVSMIFLAIATLTTNIAANVVSPANDFSNLKPNLISFKTGGLITAVIGILIMPWKLLANADIYITWLLSYSALLGPIAGILIADYYIVRKRILELPELYREEGLFRGINGKTLFVLLLAILPNLPGFLSKTTSIEGIPEVFGTMFDFAWFIGFGVAFLLYAIWKPTKTISTENG